MASQLHNLPVKLTTCCSTALRASSSGLIADQLGTALDQLLGSHGEDIELGVADHQAEVFEKAAKTISRSRLILTSNARLASSALTEWLSISLTCTSLNQPVCMMRAIPIASLRSLLLICILSTALAWRASIQIPAGQAA